MEERICTMAWDVEVTFYREIELKTESHTFQVNGTNPRNTECPLCQYYKKSKPFLPRETIPFSNKCHQNI